MVIQCLPIKTQSHTRTHAQTYIAPRNTKRKTTAMASSHHSIGSCSPSEPGLAWRTGLDRACTTFSRSSLAHAPAPKSWVNWTHRGSSKGFRFPLLAPPFPFPFPLVVDLLGGDMPR